MKKYTKYLALILSAVLLILCLMPSISADEETDAIDEGYVNVADFGADGSDKNDDYAAFEAALATGKNVYVPKGSYYVSKTIRVTDRILRGSEPGKTNIYGIMEDKKAPIVLAEGVSSVYDMKLTYTKKQCEGAVGGERVAIQLGSAEKGLESGSVIKSLYLQYAGTGVYNPKDAGCNGVLMENLQIYQTYRGVDMQGENRTSNSYSNLYINYHITAEAVVVDSGFTLEGSSYGETIHQLNVEHNTYETACVVLKNAKNINISVMHLEGVNLENDDSGWIYCENTSGYIGALTNYFTYIDTYKNSMIRFGDSDGKDKLVIGVLHNRGLNSPDNNSHTDWIAEIAERGVAKGMSVGGDTAADFRLFRRVDGAKGDYEVSLEYYTYLSYVSGTEEAKYFLNYHEPDENLSFSIKHEPKEAIRP